MAQPTYLPRKGQDADFGNVTLTGLLSGEKYPVVVKTAAYTLTPADSGKVFLADASASVIFTLPATAEGLTFTIIVKTLPTTGAGTAFSPAAADKIIGNGFTPADDKDAVCVVASDRLGDLLTVVGDGVDGWYITSVIGTWTREA